MYMIEKNGSSIRFPSKDSLVTYVNYTCGVERFSYYTIDEAIEWLQDNGWDVWEKLS